eukprot:g5645.t1
MSHHVREWFDAIDKDGNGTIDGPELQTALASGNLNFSLSSILQMIRLFSNDNKNCLHYAEFKKLHAVLEQTQKSFMTADSDHDGLLVYNEVHNAIKQTGYSIDGELFSCLMQSFDPEEKQMIDLTGYIRLTIMLRAARFAFRAFGPNESGNITLDFNQFLYVATKLV